MTKKIKRKGKRKRKEKKGFDDIYSFVIKNT